MTTTNPTAPVLTESQKNWVDTFNAYKSRIDSIQTQLRRTDLTSQAQQTFLVQQVETETALRQHFSLAYSSTHLQDLWFSYNAHNPPVNSYTIGAYIYNNYGDPTIPTS